MKSAINNVYVIDPDAAVHDALSELLTAAGARVTSFRSAEEFLRFDDANDTLHGCLLAEVDLPGMGSLAFLRQLKVRGISLPVVVLTSTANSGIADQTLKAGAVEVISKPLVGDRLLEFLRDLAKQEDASKRDNEGQRHA